MGRTVDWLYKGHDGVTPIIRKMNREQKRYESTAKASFATVRRHSTQTGAWLKRELNLRQTINSTAMRYLGGAAIAGGIYGSIKLHAQLEDAFYKLQMRAGATDEEMQRYKQGFEDLAFKTGQSMVGLVNGAAEFAGAGDSLAASFSKIETSAFGAVIAITDVETISAGIQPIMAAFRIESEKSNQVLAYMVAAADAGTIELSDLAGVMGDLTSPAQQANASLQDVLAGVEALSISGVSNANIASTAFARLMESLAKGGVGKKFEKTTKKMGMAMSFKDAQGNMRPLMENLNQISRAWQTLGTDTERNAFVEKIWGSDIRVKRALLPLLNNMDKVRGILGKIEGVTLEDLGKKLSKGLERPSTQLAALGVQVKEIGAYVGAWFEPSIKRLNELIANLRKIRRTGETDEGKGVHGGMERLTYTQTALGGGSLGTFHGQVNMLAALGAGALDRGVLPLFTKRRIGYGIRKTRGHLTPAEERAEERAKMPAESRGRVWMAERMMGSGLPGFGMPSGDIKATGPVQATGPVDAAGPVRATGGINSSGPVYIDTLTVKAPPAPKVDP